MLPVRYFLFLTLKASMKSQLKLSQAQVRTGVLICSALHRLIDKYIRIEINRYNADVIVKGVKYYCVHFCLVDFLALKQLKN